MNKGRSAGARRLECGRVDCWLLVILAILGFGVGLNTAFAKASAECDESIYVDPISGHSVHICAKTSCTEPCVGGTTTQGAPAGKKIFTCTCPGRPLMTGCEITAGCQADETYETYNPHFTWMNACPNIVCTSPQVCQKLYKGMFSSTWEEDPPEDPAEGYSVDCRCK